MPHSVFICYSSKDKLVADAACAAMEAHRIPCWIAPRDIIGGLEYGDAIIEALSLPDCKVVVLIFSENSNISPQVKREIERAVSKGKYIIPFRISDVMPAGALEYALSNTHWLDAITPPMDSRLEELCRSVEYLVRKAGGHIADPPGGTETNGSASTTSQWTAPPPPPPPPPPTIKHCPRCLRTFPVTGRFCPFDSTTLVEGAAPAGANAPTRKQCSRCQTSLPVTARFCQHCGNVA